MCNCGSGSSQNQQSTVNSLDPAIKDKLVGALDKGISAANLPYQGYGGQRIADINSTQQAGFDKAAFGASAADPAIQGAIGATSGLTRYQPQQVSGSGYTPTYGTAATGTATNWDPTFGTAATANGVTGSATMFDKGAFTPVSAQNVQTAGLPQTNLAGYMNPYTQSVIDTSMNEIDRQSQQQQQGNKGAAAMAGAFGGDRAAIMDAETQRNALNTKANTIAGLNSQNFSQASGMAQTDLARGLQAQGMNQGANLQAGLANTGYGMQMGTQNQNASNQYGLQNMSNLQQAGLFNAGNQQSMNLANMTAANQAASSNAAAANQFGLLNTQNLQQTNLANMGAYNTSQQFGSSQDFAAQQANQMAGLQGAGLNLSAANQLGSLGGLQQQTQLTGANALLGTGAQMQGQKQQNLNLGYQDFLEQRGYPMQQAQQLAGIVNGYPVGTATTSTTQLPAPSMTGQIAGLGTAGVGLYGLGKGLGFFRDGGRIDGYAGGGMVDDYDDPSFYDDSGEFGPDLMGPPYDVRNMDAVYDSPAGPPSPPSATRGGGGSYLPQQMQRALGALQGEKPQPPAFNWGARHSAQGADVPGYSPHETAGLMAPQGVPSPSYADAAGNMDMGGGQGVMPAPQDTPMPQAGIGYSQGDMGTGDPMALPPMGGSPLQGPAGAPQMSAGIGAGMAAPGGAPAAPRGMPGRPPAGPAPFNVGGMGTGRDPMAIPPMSQAGLSAPPVSADHVSQTLKKGMGAPGGAGDVPEWAIPLAMAGFSMMASRSPNALQAIGSGGVSALQSYAQQRQLRAQMGMKQAQMENTAAIQRGNLDARREQNANSHLDRQDSIRAREQASKDASADRQGRTDMMGTIAAGNQAIHADALAARQEGRDLLAANAKTPEEREADRQLRQDDQARKAEDTYIRSRAPKDYMGNPQITPEIQRAAEDHVIQVAPESTHAKSFLAAHAAAVPPQAAAALKDNPKLAPQFDAKYGVGVSKFILGR